MSDGSFIQRLSDAIQSQHEATMRLQELASELQDHCARQRSFTDRLHRMMTAELLEAPDEPLVLPQSLKNGPIFGER